jgi:tRNA (cmo5U34)-methyltransferase
MAVAGHVTFADASGMRQKTPKEAARELTKNRNILTPARDEHILRAAGFSDVSLFYVGFSFRGWVACAWRPGAPPMDGPVCRLRVSAVPTS